jgi:glucose/mannose transport system substrate-binding protein
MNFVSKRGLTAAILSTVFIAGAASAEPTAEVLHWWTSGGEAKAVQALKSDFEANGGKWIDNAVAGGAGDAAMTVLRSRALAGDPPAAAQIKGPAIQEWAKQGVLANLDKVAASENWDKVLPPAIQSVMKYQGHYVAAPVNVHRVDWLWVNPTVLAKVDGKIPTTWDEFNTLADKLKAAGITPLAHGGQPWQDSTIFETVVLGLGGPAFHKKAFVDLDEATLKSDTMVKAFDQMRKIRGYVDRDFPGREWNLATQMVMNGTAAMQIMGDWAKGEFLAAGKVPGKDFVCAPTPAPQGGYLSNVDSFAMFNVKGDDKIAGQMLFAKLLVGEKFQETFNLYKGSIPARLGVSMAKFDDCAKASETALNAASANGTLLPSMAHGMATTGSVSGAIFEVVTQHFNSTMTSQDAVKKLAEAVSLAK